MDEGRDIGIYSKFYKLKLLAYFFSLGWVGDKHQMFELIQAIKNYKDISYVRPSLPSVLLGM